MDEIEIKSNTDGRTELHGWDPELHMTSTKILGIHIQNLNESYSGFTPWWGLVFRCEFGGGALGDFCGPTSSYGAVRRG